MIRSLAILILAACALGACHALPTGSPIQPLDNEWNFPIAQSEPAQGQEEAVADEETAQEPAAPQVSEEKEEHSFITKILLYIPNRVVDLLDIVRFGVDVGPGIGLDITATEAINVTLLAKTSVGLGYQTLRHSPVMAASYAGVGVGPFKADSHTEGSWYRSPGDIRIELFVLLVGAHVAIEPFEIFDFAVGFVGIDPMDDNF